MAIVDPGPGCQLLNLPGGGGVDKFRLKVWSSNSGVVVYDNVLGSPDDLQGANPRPIDNGNVVLHGANLLGPAAPAKKDGDVLTPERLRPFVDEAVARWVAAGIAAEQVEALRAVRVEVANLTADTLGFSVPGVVWLDADAAGWGWFVDATPEEDSEFTTPGDQGEQNRMDLLTVLMHELGHVLGHDHDEGGVMAETLAPGQRLLLGAHRDVRVRDDVFSALETALVPTPFWVNVTTVLAEEAIANSRRRR